MRSFLCRYFLPLNSKIKAIKLNKLSIKLIYSEHVVFWFIHSIAHNFVIFRSIVFVGLIFCIKPSYLHVEKRDKMFINIFWTAQLITNTIDYVFFVCYFNVYLYSIYQTPKTSKSIIFKAEMFANGNLSHMIFYTESANNLDFAILLWKTGDIL